MLVKRLIVGKVIPVSGVVKVIGGNVIEFSSGSQQY